MRIPIITEMSKHKFLYMLATFYICMVMISDLYESKIIHIWFVYSGSGIILFSTTFFLIAIISYVYNAKIAQLIILFGVIFCLIFMCATYALDQVSAGAHKYTLILRLTQNIFFATAASSFISENINANLVALLKNKLDWMPAICLIVSIMVSSLVSMALFSALAFGYRIGIHNLLAMTLSSWIYRFITETILTLSLSSYIIRKLQIAEGMTK